MPLTRAAESLSRGRASLALVGRGAFESSGVVFVEEPQFADASDGGWLNTPKRPEVTSLWVQDLDTQDPSRQRVGGGCPLSQVQRAIQEGCESRGGVLIFHNVESTPPVLQGALPPLG